MQNEIEKLIQKAGLKKRRRRTVREMFGNVGRFYRAAENTKKPGLSTKEAKRELIPLKLTDDARKELSRRLDKYAAISSGAKCDGSLMTDPQRWTESSLLLRCRI
jgi:hypothetical protein